MTDSPIPKLLDDQEADEMSLRDSLRSSADNSMTNFHSLVAEILENMPSEEQQQQSIYERIDDHYSRRAVLMLGPWSDKQHYLVAIEYLNRNYQQDIVAIEHSHSTRTSSGGYTVTDYTAIVRFYCPVDFDGD